MIKKSPITIVIFMLFVITTTVLAADKYQWKLVDTKDNCQIYTSDVPGKDYIAAKATCEIPAGKEVLGVVLRDIANYPKWMEDCTETKMLKVVDDENDVFIFWFRQHVTLKTDRDMVLKAKTIIDPPRGRDTIYVESTNEMNYDSGKGYVRMPSFYSQWTLDWVSREKTRVTFMIDPDLGEGLPKFIANPLIKSNPFKTLKKMMKMVKEPKYIEEAKKSKYLKMVEDAIKAGHVKP
ncbi:MAG: hypothetical protein JW976_02080 [Syntrophaceae bacterium]|nr:hypothetical protein [Syntrophaceae bacterium]